MFSSHSILVTLPFSFFLRIRLRLDEQIDLCPSEMNYPEDLKVIIERTKDTDLFVLMLNGSAITYTNP